MLTGIHHPTGTDRIAEISETVSADVYVNVQGDEPLIHPETIAICARPLLDDTSIQMGSIYSPCPDEERENSAVVKVVTDLEGFALYFSRYPIPFPRNSEVCAYKKHVGIYAYRKEVVQAFANWEQSPLEKAESLEQLRFMEHAVRIKMSRGEGSALAVDTPEQAEEVRRLLQAQKT